MKQTFLQTGIASWLIGVIIVAVVAFIILIFLITAYNRLTRARIKVDNSWSQINVQLKMRADLIPNLVETVQGYTRHEQETLNQIMETRSRYLSAQTTDKAVQSSSEMGGWVNRLFAVAEQYPDLKADGNFQQLQGQLSEIEQKVALSRQFYNDSVMLYNRQVQLFPSNLTAALFGFKSKVFFEAGSEATEQTRVQF